MKKTCLVLAVTLSLVAVANANALKYTIDGNLSDWGITLGELNQGFYPTCNDTAWLPSDSQVMFVVEDNRDPNYGQASGGYPTGVHIFGQGQSYSKFDEPLISNQVPPIGGETFDIEAMYFDEDSQYVYVAIVLTTPSKTIGDLGLNLDGIKTTGGYGYEYAVLLNTNNSATQFTIYRTPTVKDWTTTSYSSSSPGYINLSNNPTVVGHAIGAYVEYPNMKDWDTYSTHIVELAIKKDEVGLSGKSIGITSGANIKTVLSKFHLSSTGDCGNDIIHDQIPVSEFMSILIPLGVAIGSLCYFRRFRS